MTFKGTNRAICACFIIITLTVALLEKSKKWVHSKISRIQQNQEFVTGHTDEQPDDKATLVDWFKKPDRPLTPDADGLRDNVLTTDLWISKVAHAKDPPTIFDDRTELEYHFEECFKATNERLDWHNPEGKQYLFDLRKPLSLIQDHQVRQVIPKDYFINNDLEYLKGERLSKKYSTSITKTKAATYEIKWIEDMVLTLVSKHHVYSRKRIIAITHVLVMKWYNYGYLEEIVVRREDDTTHKFKEGDFSNLNMHDIEDMLLLLVQKKIYHLRVKCSIANVHKTRRHSETSGRSSTGSRKLQEEAKYHQA
ncbi:hypothetical protein Tco_0966839 [Tanacetum coccineum]